MADFRWGILGPGAIAHKFATAITATEGMHLAAVGSRSIERASAFVSEYGNARAHGSYDKLVRDPAVDAIYIATPHSAHRDCAIQALGAGKAVLCEKPLAVNANEVRAMIDAAQTSGQFLMEAMWTRFLPIMTVIRDWIDSGAIGAVRMLQADFGFRFNGSSEHRLLNPALAGGALLDVGIYPLAFARWVFGQDPVEIQSSATLGETGVDEQNAMVFRYNDGALALLSSAIRTQTQHCAVILGTEGRIEVPAFWRATEATLIRGDVAQTESRPHAVNGYEYEALAVKACREAGETECAVVSLGESLSLAETMDQLRAQWGVAYPMEQQPA